MLHNPLLDHDRIKNRKLEVETAILNRDAMYTRMTDIIPPANLEHLLMVQHAVRHTAKSDIGDAVRTALGKTATKQEMTTVAIRLVALTNLGLLEPEFEGDSVDIAVLKAAARAPLFRGKTPALTVFDAETFRRIVREESPPED